MVLSATQVAIAEVVVKSEANLNQLNSRAKINGIADFIRDADKDSSLNLSIAQI
jgi:hypothetical protein